MVQLTNNKNVQIKFPTLKKGDKRKQNAPSKPSGARGPFNLKAAGKATAKAMTMAEQL